MIDIGAELYSRPGQEVDTPVWKCVSRWPTWALKGPNSLIREGHRGIEKEEQWRRRCPDRGRLDGTSLGVRRRKQCELSEVWKPGRSLLLHRLQEARATEPRTGLGLENKGGEHHDNE